jgi:tRNA (cytidine/uridine-2'-O-)-methyltransferase
MDIALYQPDIAGNVGAMLRTAACFSARVHIIEPCGFPFSMHAFRRTAMDYADAVEVMRHADWAAFRDWARTHQRRLVLLTTQGGESLYASAMDRADVLVLGSEGAGVPTHVHAAIAVQVRIPMAMGMRSLNVGVAAGIALAEALRQIGGLPE